MDRSLLSAVSGIDANQSWLDVIGNNIANANTTGFKQDNVTFDDLLSQQIQGATAPNGTSMGGSNAVSVGTGTRTAAITPDESQGTLQQTNNPTDAYINGNGYFVANSQGTQLYSRDGTMMFDSNGNMVTPNGAYVQGWNATLGVINTSNPPANVTIPVGLAVPPKQTVNVNLGGNLPADATTGQTETATVTVYDQQGNALPMSLTFTKLAASNQWSVQGTSPNFTFAGVNMTFNGAGVLQTVNGAAPNAQGVISYAATTTTPDADGGTFSSGASISLNFPATASGQNNVTQYSGADTVQALSQDGYASGTLASLSLGDTGIITGAFTNGQSQQLGQLALANFANPTGLQAVGSNMWEGTANSGIALVGTPGSGGRGTITGGALEASNVDMSTQLTNLVVAQNSYQANTRVVTSDATVLNSLIQMA